MPLDLKSQNRGVPFDIFHAPIQLVGRHPAAFWLALFLVILLVYVSFRAFTQLNRYLKSQDARREIKPDGRDTAIKEMVQDPVCGVFITAQEAITTVDKGKTVYFCSTQCRDKYVNGQR